MFLFLKLLYTFIQCTLHWSRMCFNFGKKLGKTDILVSQIHTLTHKLCSPYGCTVVNIMPNLLLEILVDGWFLQAAVHWPPIIAATYDIEFYLNLKKKNPKNLAKQVLNCKRSGSVRVQTNFGLWAVTSRCLWPQMTPTQVTESLS